MAITNKQLFEKLEEVHEGVKQNRKDIGTITVCLTGTVDGESKGINGRLDATEADIKTLRTDADFRKKTIAGTVVTAVGAIIAAAWQAINSIGH